jgi:hypothetical protein
VAGDTEDLNLSFGTDSDGGGIRPVTNPTRANDGDIDTVAGRDSYFNGSGTDTWYLKADLGSAREVTEIVVHGGMGNVGEHDPAWDIEHSDNGSSWATAVGTYVWDTTPNPNTATLTLTSPATKRYWRIGQSVGPGFVLPLKVHTWEIIGTASAETPANIIWIDAPLAIDGSDSTYEGVQQEHSPFLRHTLDDAYVVDSARLRVSWTSNTNRTLTIQGANESDFSDAVTLDTHAYTPTGGLTNPDTLNIAWSTVNAYQYFQYLTSVENWFRVYESELYQAGTGAAAVSSNTLALGGVVVGNSAASNTHFVAISSNSGLWLTHPEGAAGGGLNDQGTFTYLDAAEAAAPGTPASGKVRLYAKTDGRIYSKDDAGNEFGPFDAAGGGGYATITSGGTHTTSGGFEYYAFTSSGTLVVAAEGLVEAVVVGGGGGGGGYFAGGGGGAGGVVHEELFLTAGSHDVVVGAGGAGGSATASANIFNAHLTAGDPGEPSYVAGLTAHGGGRGGGIANTTGSVATVHLLTGGSGGGGGGRTSNVGGADVDNQGNDGGTAISGSTAGTGGGGGGGGAGAVGGNASSTNVGGNGGNGVTPSGFSSFGASGVFGGGGGGGARDGGTGGTGGTGGGGNGGVSSANTGASAGTANTGGGGGGAGHTSTTAGTGQAGGSGAVIIRVPS